ncbi:hypothetical protein IWW45_000231 [Coemansia sp. RSA 485]|nr:hypothetical protein IWW45_000231 [Coemansia sp. RSA 485]
MTEPFRIVRRKPAASATYGRKALAARRIGISRPVLVDGLDKQPQPLKTPSSLSLPAHIKANKSTTDSDIASASNSSDSDSALDANSVLHTKDKKGTNEAKKRDKMLDGSWTHRTAHSAMSRLDSLYQSTKAAESVTLQKPLESIDDCWGFADLGQGHARQKQHSVQMSPETADQPQRIVLDNTDLIVTGDLAARSLSAGTSGSTKKSKPKPSRARGAGRALPKPADVMHKLPPVAPMQTAPLKSGPRSASTNTVVQSRRARNGTNSRKGTGNSSDVPDIAVDPVVSDGFLLAKTDTQDTDDIAKSSLPGGHTKATKRKAPALARRSNRKNISDRRSSSPPSVLSRQLERSRISKSSSDWAKPVQTEVSDSGSELDSMFNQNVQTPRAQVNNKHILRSTQGPSSATSKRLQARAVRQNVVYTYGRMRGSDDGSDLEHMFGLPSVLGTVSSQHLLGHDSVSINDDFSMSSDLDFCESKQSRAASAHGRHLLDLVDFATTGGCSDDGRSSTTESFKKQISDVLQAFPASTPGCSPETGCRLLLDGLYRADFCDELLNSKYWLHTLIQTLYRNRSSPAVQSTTIVVIACAFRIPTVMQSLVFDRQILETVAEALKLASDMDILSLRRRRDFDSSDQHKCIAQICTFVRKQLLVGSSMPISCYNVALSALHGFARTDDAAFLAMAPLLRNEVRESGCLGLVIERVFAQSIPGFIDPKKQQHKSTSCAFSRSSSSFSYSPFDDICATDPISFSGRLLRFASPSNGCSEFSDSEDENESKGDVWMDFDMPDGPKDILSHTSAASFKRRNKAKTKAAAKTKNLTENIPRENTSGIPEFSNRTKDQRRALKSEPLGTLPTFASIAAELEFLRFCTSASSDNQSEMLETDSCIPMLLSLLTMCQEESTGLHGAHLIRALETAALTLQLLVNLSNSSTVFSSKFVAERGLNVVSKSIALMAQKIKSDHCSSRNPMPVSNFSPRRKALLDDANDLRYDILLITSALLTNLVESDPSTALYFNHVMQSPRCLLNKQCFPECTCPDRISLNVLLSQAFSACHAVGSRSPDAVVAAGYISVLLGFLMRGKTATRDTILKNIPGGDTLVVVAHIEKFIELSDSVNQRFGGLIGGLARAAKTSKDEMHIAYQDIDNGDYASISGGKVLALSSTAVGTSKLTKPSKMAISLRSIIDALVEI